MQIQLNDSDLAQMPSALSSQLLHWLRSGSLKSGQSDKSRIPSSFEQLALTHIAPNSGQQHQSSSKDTFHPNKKSSSRRAHVLLSQLLDFGITEPGMLVRVRLKAIIAKKTGHGYVTKNLKISTKGTVLYNGQEFNKPSPLAESINGSSANGWEYVEVKKNGQWVCLNELRQIWRRIS